MTDAAPGRRPTRWEAQVQANPEHSRWYVERFRQMAAQGADLAGEAPGAERRGVDGGHAGAAFDAVGHEQERACGCGQWLVPSSKVILFQTLYLPIGFLAGRRLTSSKVEAS